MKLNNSGRFVLKKMPAKLAGIDGAGRADGLSNLVDVESDQVADFDVGNLTAILHFAHPSE